MTPDKLQKLLALALDPSTSDHEASTAALHFLRKGGATMLASARVSDDRENQQPTAEHRQALGRIAELTRERDAANARANMAEGFLRRIEEVVDVRRIQRQPSRPDPVYSTSAPPVGHPSWNGGGPTPFVDFGGFKTKKQDQAFDDLLRSMGLDPSLFR